ncbi:IS21 family transposase [Sinomicrobium pectinilyticum]|uniref:IS21 family transposase n=1 Tax=Sinomicrobium pectinilyticum TaxID=1084421 RepID=A0A3N0CVG4_SINP1|nr:IS21 family transposase [Sinomicrobium pectinilyticum]RNL67462.1 IS21 family transposase [Sinomicrobium pectinilyticum]
MANALDPMDLKQIIRLHLDGFSNRNIGATLGLSRNTVNHYIKRFKASDYTMEALLSFDQGALLAQFPAYTTIDNDRYNELMLYFEGVNKARNHPGFTFLHHYQEYNQTAKAPYSYTQFMEHYHRRYAHIKGSMKLEHDPAKEMYIDFAGKKLHIVDRDTGELVPVEVFIAILPHSQYTYVSACRSQKREDLIGCCQRALHFYGGVPKAIVSDNLKSAVNRASKYEPQINRTFKEFAHHYNCVINPTRSYAPQDKALVENAVHLVYQRIYYPLREMTFFSLADLNREIRRLLETYNNLLFQRKEASRKELFQSVERSYLKPLSQQPYALKNYRRAKVQKMGYVYFSPDKSYYSVPYRYIGKHTMIHYTQSTVEVYYNHQRIALHKRHPAKGSYITNKDHLSSTHKAYTQWSPEYFKQLASRHGQHVLTCIARILTSTDYPETGYRRAMGVIQLHKTYGSQRLNGACQVALQADTASYRRICNILKNNMDQTSLFDQDPEEDRSHIPKHGNIRGASTYK